MTKRVLLTCEDYFPLIGGAEVCVHMLKQELTRLGWEVTLYTNTMGSHSSDDERIVRVPWKFRPSTFLRNVRTLQKLIKHADIVHCQYSFRLACICAVFCRLMGKPMLLTQQGRGIVPEARQRLRDKPLYKLCQWVSMKGASLLTSTSEEITDLTAAFVPRSKIVPVTNGYDARMFTPDHTRPVPPEYQQVKDKTIFLTVRRLVPKNGIHILIQALGILKKTHPDFHYLAVGDGRSRSFIESLIEEFELQSHVTLLGKRENDSLPAYYEHADAVIVPSSAEATSIACIEAMGMGKPIIASRVGGLIDLLEKNGTFGTLVSIYDSEACTYDPPDRMSADRLQPLVDALRRVMDDPKPLITQAERGRVYAEKHYSWEAITNTYVSLYERLSVA
jgi:glycosyltransferase involved in cell wall biosynthesis